MIGYGLDKPISRQMTRIGWSHKTLRVENPEVRKKRRAATGDCIGARCDAQERHELEGTDLTARSVRPADAVLVGGGSSSRNR